MKRMKFASAVLILGMLFSAVFSANIYGETPQEIAASLSYSQSESPNPDLKTVVILATGGTIAGSGAAGKTTNYKAGELDVQSLIDSVPGIEDLANIRGIQVSNIGSDDITATHWLTMINIINEMSREDDVAGFVITHGTDTLDETVYFLNLAAKTNKPIVVVGAMRPSTSTSADGPMNLYQAVAVAASPEAVGKGAMCVFSDGIYGGRDVQKTSTFSVTAFDGKDMGCLGYIRDDVPYFYSESTKLHTTQTEFYVDSLTELPKVTVLYFNIDADPGLVDYAAENSDGLIIAGAGCGCYSDLFNQKIAALEERGFPVVRCSRISNGVITADDYFDSFSNVILGDNLAPQKAKILLQLALTKTSDIEEIKEMFTKY